MRLTHFMLCSSDISMSKCTYLRLIYMSYVIFRSVARLMTFAMAVSTCCISFSMETVTTQEIQPPAVRLINSWRHQYSGRLCIFTGASIFFCANVTRFTLYQYLWDRDRSRRRPALCSVQSARLPCMRTCLSWKPNVPSDQPEYLHPNDGLTCLLDQ